jgi:toxin ParE1/3/4
MRIRWTEEAVLDLERISDYLFEQTPIHAPRVAWQIYGSASELVQFPLRGRVGKREGTRELVLSPLPYIIVYTVEEETVHIVRILHGAQRWP